jgi:predicted permease
MLTWWALYVLPHFTIPSVPQLGDLLPVPSWRVFCFALGASIGTILCAGALPAWRAAMTDPAEPMKEGSATTTGRLRDRYNPLIVLEVALSTALLMCSALFVVIAVRLAAFDFRYAAKQLVYADVAHGGRNLGTGDIAKFYDELVERAASTPHARFAATSHWGTPDGKIAFAEEGKSGDTWMNLNSYAIVSPNYFRTMGIPIVRGRDFMPGDARGPMAVVIVDEQSASRLWPDVPDPVGRMLKLGRKESPAPWLRVIGVSQFIEYLPRKDIDLPPDPVVYVVTPNDGATVRRLLVRGDGVNGERGRAALSTVLQQEIHRQLPAEAEVPVRPWLDDYENQREMVGFLASIFGAFAGFGLVLCAVGLYGVLAYTVGRRLREFAVRIALGARRRDVMRLVLHDAAVTALGGVGIGAFIALAVTRSIVEGIGAFPYAAAIALVASELVLFGVAFIASLGPVRRAAQASPTEILRAN